MNSMHVHLFGKLSVEIDQKTEVEFESSKAQELFCFLMLNQKRAHPREALMCLLWNNTDANHSRRYLRKTLWQLQSAINIFQNEKEKIIFLIEPDWIQVNPDANLWIDASVFEEAYNQVRGRPANQLSPSQVRTMETAVDIYQGDLLEGWYQEWCIFERERLQQLFILILDKLVEYAEFQHQLEKGVYYANRILQCDCARERTYRSLMRLFSYAGDRTTALRQYEKCLTILDDELGIAPAAKTNRLYEQIKIGIDPNVSFQAEGNSISLAKRDAKSEMLENLQLIQGAIKRVQHLLHQIEEESE